MQEHMLSQSVFYTMKMTENLLEIYFPMEIYWFVLS